MNFLQIGQMPGFLGAAPENAADGLPKFKMGVPKLDFSNMKQVKEADWYTQCQKLEQVITFLREKITKLEETLENAHATAEE